MDDAMIARLLQTYGAQPSARNANAARQFFATNPEIAEKRAMGMRGSGVDDNSDIFGAQLEKFMQAAEAEAPPGRVEVGQPEVVALPATQAAPTARASAPTSTNMSAQPGASRQAEYGSTGPITREAARGGKGFGVDDVITALLGLSSTAGRKMMGNVDPNDPRLPPQLQGPEKLAQLTGPEEPKRLTYQPKLEEGGANARAAEADKTKTITSDPALEAQGKKAQLQAEIDAENADAKRLQDQIMERQRGQVETKKLSDAAKRAVGRR